MCTEAVDHVIGPAGGKKHEHSPMGARSRAPAIAVAVVALVAVCAAALIAWSGGSSSSRHPLLAAAPPALGPSRSPARTPVANGLSLALGSPRAAVTPATAPADFYPDRYRPGKVLVGFRSGVTAARRSAITRAVGAYGARQLGPTIKPAGHGRVRGPEFLAPYELRIPTRMSVLAVARRLRGVPGIAYAEPNYLEAGDAAPNDPSFPVQWGDENTGQLIPSQNSEEELGAEIAGTPGADDHALKAWKVTTGSRSVVIGEVDTGIDLTHPDLAANIWSNPGGVFKCPAGTHGYNVVSKTCVPEDEDELYEGHGTHVAGIMGAVGNNEQGVAGINWQTTILPVKWMHGAGSGETSALIEAIQFEVAAKQEGVNVRVINDSDSFFGTARSEALENEIEVAGANNILFVTSAGNTGNNNDEAGGGKRFPCSSDKPTEICVTATNNKDELPSWANYGPHTVQLAAPGVSIYSTKRGNGYRYLSGGSMAAPQVSGAAALILSVAPSLTVEQLKKDIIEHVDRLPPLEGEHGVESKGRLDVCKALPGCEKEIVGPPVLEKKPTVTGTAQAGKTLTAGAGEWSEEPIAYSYQWKRCNGRGEEASCSTISGATNQTYTTGSADVGKTLRVVVIATNGKGSSKPASSEPPTAPVKPAELTCGKTSVGGTAEGLSAERKRVSPCKLETARPIQRLEIYLQPGGTSGQELFEGVVYAEASGAPGALLGTTAPLTFKSTNAAGWYELAFITPLNLAAGNYWIGAITGPTSSVAAFRYDSVKSGRQWNTNEYSKGPSSPFSASGKVTTDEKQASLYAADTVLGVPVDTALPTVSGTAVSREPLTAGTGTWVESPTEYAYQWERCNTAGEACKNIEGAIASSYTPGPADVGSTLRAAVNAINATGSSTPEAPCSYAACSKPTGVIAPATPAVVEGKGPAVAGKAEDEQTLTAENGSWTESPTGFSYVWQRCNNLGEGCKAIEKATSSTYKLSPGEVGSTLRVSVTAKNAVGLSSPALSSQTAVVAPAPPAVVEGKPGPAISGTARDGLTLTAENGTWKGTPTITFSYQWLRCEEGGSNCKPIEGAVASTYKLSSGEVGSTLKLTVTAKNEGGEVSVTSAKTAVVAPAPPVAEKPLPEVSGKAEDGETLGSSTGTWSGTPPLSFSYQWQRCSNLGEACKNIEGAVGSTYALGHGDVGTTLKVLVTAKNAGGEATAASKVTPIVAPLAPSLIEGLKISGKSEDEQTLTAETGVWKGTPTINYSYLWEACNSSGGECKAIEGQTSSTLLVASNNVGQRVRLIVTAKNAGGEASAGVLSAVIAPAPPVDKVAPTIKGTAKDGQLLTAENGTWKGTPTIKYNYQWEACESLGGGCLPISGATGATHRIASGEVGNTLRVIVTAKNGGGEASASALSELVTATAPSNNEKPQISGSAVDEQSLATSTGSWSGTPTITFTYQWQRCNSTGGECKAIEGATSPIYDVGHADVGSKLRIIVTAKNAGGEATSFELTPVVAATAPTNEVAPAITGTLKDGQTLKAENGTWKGTPTIKYSYLWEACNSTGGECTAIGGATGSTLLLGPTNVGNTVKLIVTAKNGGGEAQASVTSAVIGATAPTNEVAPAITGTLKDGQTLKAENGTWKGTPTIKYSYLWEACNSTGGECTAIGGATGSTLLLGPTNVGNTVKLIVTAKNGGGEAQASVTSAVIGATAPTNEVAPAITGTLKDGQTLTAENGTWKGTPTIKYSYLWEACNSTGGECTAIGGATGSTLLLGPTNVGNTVKLIVTAKNGGGEAQASVTSAVIGATAPTNEVAPAITGTLKDGQTLKAENGTWKGTPTIKYSYLWEACNSTGGECTAIGGATGSTLLLGPTNVGNTVKLIVTAKNGGGEAQASVTSAVIGATAPTNEVAPAITGTLKDGQTLKAENGTWKGTPTIKYSYLWEACNSTGGECTAIGGATGSTLLLGPTNVGNTVKLIVTAKNGGGEAQASVTSAVIGATAPTNEVAPAITGTLKDGQTLKAENGTWKGTPTIKYSYLWEACNSTGGECTAIGGATGSTLLLGPTNVGNTVKLIVTAKNGGGEAQASVTSAVIGATAPTNEVAPAITGTLKDGQTLKAENGTWKGTPTIKYSYLWEACNSTGGECTAIGGATGSTLLLGPTNVGNTVKLIVTAKNGGGEAQASVTSAVIGATAPTNEVAPAITGTLKDGQTLKAENGTWKGTPTIKYSYLWEACNSTGGECTAIGGATGSTLLLGPTNVGNTVKLIVTAKNGGGEAQASVTSAVIGATAPTNEVAPAITGTLKDGQTLKAENGTWKGTPTIKYSYLWEACNSTGGECTAIGGATGSTLLLGPTNVGNTVKLIVTAKNGGGEAQASVTSAVIGATAPTNEVAPAITGTLKDGQTLTAENGTWKGTPTIKYSYLWEACNSTGGECTAIGGATGSTLLLGPTNVGNTVKLIVTAKNGGGEAQASVTSAVIGATAPTNEVAPAITGTLKDGQTLTGENGTWKGTPTIKYSYLWEACNSTGGECTAIGGATGSTLLLGPTNVGNTVKLIVTAKNGGGEAQASVTSAVIGATAPTNEVAPAITGTLKDGQTLKAENGTWEGTPTITYGYQWQLCNGAGEACKNIVGAEAQTYKLSSPEVGSTLKVIVTAKNGGGEASAASEHTAVVTPLPPANEVAPTIKGTAKDGQTLTAENGTWSESPTGFSYLWEACNGSGGECEAIEGATNSTLVVGSGSVGGTVKLIVTAKNAGGEASDSVLSAVVEAAGPVNEVLPRIKGTPKDGQTLTAENGTWKGTPTITYSYQWESCNALGEGCLPIEGATGSTYKLSSSEIGTTLKLIVTAKNGGGETSAASLPSPMVEATAPTNEALPAITGEAKDGQTLKAENGTWEGTPTITYGYQWQLCNGAGEACKNIVGAEAQTYKLSSPEVGSTLKVIVTAKNGGGEASAASEHTAVVTPLPPANEVAPTIKGTAKDGQTLTAENGTWSESPTGFSYLWEACNGSGGECEAIEGATNSTLVVGSGSVGGTVKLIVTAKNAGGEASDSVLSAVVEAAGPVNEVLPRIKGTPKDGQTLTAENGTWKGTPTITYSYQWESCNALGEGCLPIEGATGSTYKLSSSEIGTTLKLIVTAKNGGGETSAASGPTAVVTPLGPVNEVLPTISGEAKEGQTLTAENGTWTESPTGYSYQWKRCNESGASCKSIPGATSQMYSAVLADVKSTLRVSVTASNAGIFSIPAVSPASQVIGSASPVNTLAPTITGEAKDGQTLKAENGTWEGTPTITYGYQWQLCNGAGEACKNIVGAEAQTYKLSSPEVGLTLKVIVTAKNGGGETPAASGKSAVVGALAPKNTLAPTITGEAKDGQTLKAENGTWEGTPTITYGYQWQLCNGAGEACKNIVGAEAQTYKLSSPEVGLTLKVIVTAKNGGGETPAASGKSAVVGALAPKNTLAPTITGEAKDGQTLKAENGTWEGTPTITYGYQWQLCNGAGEACKNIVGAEAQTYKLSSPEVGLTLKVIVTAKNGGGETPAASGKSAVVGALAPKNTLAPTITGEAKDGQTLKAENGTWEGTPTITYGYQWQLCNGAGEACKNIVGAEAQTYKLSSPEVGLTLKVIVTAKNGGGETPAASGKSAVVGALAPKNTLAPTITGEAKDGQTLKAENGTWEGTPTITYGYQWQLCNGVGEACKNIVGAEAQTYKLSSPEVGLTLKVIVTAKNGGGETPAASGKSAVVGALAPKNTLAPTITGEAKDGQTLKAENGTWEGTPTITYGYQWQLCNGAGEACKNIVGAEAQTYKLSSPEVGLTLKVIVTAKNGGGETPAASGKSAVVGALAPKNTLAPTITGEAKDGQTLKAENGTWEGTPTITYGYQWQLCNGAGEACKNIVGAEAQTYKLSSPEVGLTLKVIVTAKNGGGETPAASGKSAVVGALAPKNTLAPTITGEAKDGQTLKAENGTWEGTPTITYGYQWQLCNGAGEACKNIVGAEAQTYKLSSPEVGLTLKVIVTAKNGGGETPAASGKSAVVGALAPKNTLAPTITGEAKDGQTLKAENGTWEGTPTITYGYQWQLCNGAGEACKNIVGAEAQTYKLSSPEVGLTLKVIVTAKNGGGETPAASGKSAVVGALAPKNTLAPTITGEAKDGQTLKAENGTWEGTPTITYGYQWQLCNGVGEACKNIVGAEAQTYKLSSPEVGLTLKVIVTAKNGGGETPAASGKSAVVGALAPKNTLAPTITGEAKDGQTLKAENGTWEGTPTITYGYQWQLCNGAGEACKNIVGAEAQTYKLSSPEVGLTLKVIVTAKNGGGETPAASGKSAVVGALAPKNTLAPTITGEAKDGQTLKAENGTWEGTPTITYGYQWQLCNGAGEACKNIVGAEAQTYKLSSPEVGLTLKVIVTAKNGGGETPAASGKSAVVGALAPKNTLAPTITGEAKDGQTLKAENGTWEGTPTITYGYQWQLCNGAGEACKNIVGAEAQTYKLSSPEVGLTLKVIVTAKNGGGETPAASGKSAVVGALAPKNTLAPTITGEAKDGQTLKAENGTWEGTPTITYGYQWQLCNGAGEACKNIVGAEAQTYKLSSPEVGLTLKVIVTAKNGGGETPAASGKSAVVGALAPKNTLAPTITGEAKDGQTLKAENGTWEGTPTITYGYQWQLCNGAGEACKNIVGAEAQTYKLSSPEVGLTLKVIVTAKNGGGETPAASGKSAVVGALAPKNTLAPTITGEAKDGQTLKAENGTWEGTPTITYGYQWQLCNGAGEACKNIVGAEAQTYKLSSPEVGLTLKVIVTAKNGGGETPAASGKSAVVGALAPKNTLAPTITGEAKDGQTLKAENGTWEGTPTITYGYQWQLCNGVGEACKNIVGAEAQTYKLSSPEVGLTLKVIVTAKNGGGETPAASGKSAVVGALAPKNTLAPTITGEAKDGQTLKAENGTWEGTPTITYGYQWQLCNGVGEACKNIVGAEAQTYKLSSPEVGLTLKVIVTAKNGGGETPAASGKSAVVGALAPKNTLAPTITGEAKDGQTLKAENGTWEGTPTITYGYQWQLCNGAGEACKNIVGAEAQTYKLSSPEVGLTLKVIVTAKNGGGETPAASGKSAVVAAAPPVNEALPAIKGLVQEGQTLTAENGTWKGTPTITYGYQWQSCSGLGEGCLPIKGAIASTYKIGSEGGTTLRVIVTAKNGGGEVSATSAQTTVVPASATFGPTTPGTLSDTFAANRKRVSRYALPVSGSVTKLSIYLAPTGTAGSQVLEGIVYSDSSGAPATLLGTSSPLTFTSTSATGWYELTFPTPLNLAAGNYWIGVITGATSNVAAFNYTTVTAGRDYNTNTYTSGPTSTFGAVTIDTEQTSLYATYTPTEPVGALAPKNTLAPTITGEAKDGQTLKAENGTWEGTPTITYGYQWQLCNGAGEACKNIEGASASTYKLSSPEVGATLKVIVTAKNGGGETQASAKSAVIAAAPPVNELPPAIKGKPEPGQTLTAENGTWKGTPTITYTYQWQLCNGAGEACKNIEGAKSSTYKPSSGEVGSTLKVIVTAKNGGGEASVASPSILVVEKTSAPVDKTAPKITGEAKDGQTLTAENGTWEGTPTITFSYQWQRCNNLGEGCKNIEGATVSAYKLSSAEVGLTLKVVVTAKNGGGETAAASAKSPVVVAAPPVNKTPPAIGGTPQEGKTLTAENGTWEGTPTITYSYQWQLCNGAGEACKNIEGASAQTYKLSSPEVGATLKVIVTAKNGGGEAASPSGKSSVVVAGPPVNKTLPAIKGKAEEGQTLTAENGTWEGTPTITYSYQWQSCNSLGEGCKNITGATAATYKLKSTEVGSTLRVIVTAKNGGGEAAATSIQTTPVAGAPTFGPTTPGTLSDTFAANRKRVSRYALPVSGSVTKLSIYLAPAGTAGSQVLEGIVYSDSSGAPATLLGTSSPLTFTSTSATGWYELTFPTPLNLAAGNYWIGVITGATSNVAAFRYTTVAGSRDYNSNTYTSGPTSAFGAVTTDSEQMSLYATY